ncbi:triose-phosphate isomerase [Candidatus Woesearchaeota archaeon]|nr:triose-phosphate isomerase [Candidatus Woesearchaeota archaeon]
MRKTIIAGNWKMNKTNKEAASLMNDIIFNTKNVKDVEIIVCPPYTALSDVNKIIKKTNIELGAQDVYFEEKGAFTSKISAEMLKDVGCTYVIIGHSETRQYFNETDESVNKKVKIALSYELKPIICVGETLEQREAEKTMKIIETQIKGALKDITKEQMVDVVIAYEPVWAIGTGKTATPEQAQEVHYFIRNLILNLYSPDIAESIRILYGGSVKPNNVKELMQEEDIDGGLIGGASLDAESFSKLVRYKEL